MKKIIGLLALSACLSIPAVVSADSNLKPSVIPSFDIKAKKLSTASSDMPHIILAGRGNGGGGGAGGGRGGGNGNGGRGSGNGGGGTGSGTGGGICDGSGTGS